MRKQEFDGLRDFSFDRRLKRSLQDQLSKEIKQRILTARLLPETRLPSSRHLAQSLSVSRNTVNAALEQLKAEGYLKTRPGAGHYVSDEIPDNFLLTAPAKQAHTTPNESLKKPTQRTPLPLSSMGRTLSQNKNTRQYGNSSFETGVPDLRAFPIQKWAPIYQRNNQRTSLMGYDQLQGYAPLREILADYLRSSRGLRCTAKQIIITAGAQQAATIAVQILLDKGDQAYVENPGYIGLRKVLHAHGAHPVGIPVGEQGIDLSALPPQPSGKLLCLTPTHQYPMGGIIPLAKRLAILQWAADHGVWLLEDDYDSEYHFDHKPIPAMQGLGLAEQVIYLGSFSKVLYPALRLGYLVVPEHLVDACVTAKTCMTGQTALVEQATTAEFIEAGHFVRHIRKMRVLYQEKQRAILAACKKHLDDVATPHYTGAGMHIVVTFHAELNRHGFQDVEVVDAMIRQGIYGSALSAYYLGQPQHQGLVLGFANTHAKAMHKKIKIIREVIDSLIVKN
ncbi:MAG: GntR family transcriptional regulator [Moraxellaceae bacterium]|nr:MAG: GntR family transcriptional regulator [Moraxellaceae bacterium]